MSERVGGRHTAHEVRRIRAFAMNHLALRSTPTSSSSVESLTPVHSAQEGQPVQSLHVSWHWQRGEQWRAVAAAFDETDARRH
jgi:hypothetical protein